MKVGLKDLSKLIGVSIVSCCAVFVCNLFLNYNIDVAGIEGEITNEYVRTFYDAQVMQGKVICIVSGDCLLVTSVIMLFFYIKNYIDTHGRELGILKAMGYSDVKIAGGFRRFGLSVFFGTAVGFCSSFALMPLFYEVMNEDKILPDISVNFHFALFLYLVIIPAVVFALISFLYGCCKLKRPALELLKGSSKMKAGKIKHRKSESEGTSFLQDLKRSTVRNRKTLVFFIAFASFCYSAMMQMSFSMSELSSVMFSAIMLIIGIVLACTTMFLAVTTVVNSNTKTISMMRVFGYSFEECSRAILGGYRPIAYVGFAIGTIYQYALLKIMVGMVFSGIENVPEYNFDFPAFIIVLISFAVVYELIMYFYTARIKKISVKEIMLE